MYYLRLMIIGILFLYLITLIKGYFLRNFLCLITLAAVWIFIEILSVEIASVEVNLKAIEVIVPWCMRFEILALATYIILDFIDASVIAKTSIPKIFEELNRISRLQMVFLIPFIFNNIMHLVLILS